MTPRRNDILRALGIQAYARRAVGPGRAPARAEARTAMQPAAPRRTRADAPLTAPAPRPDRSAGVAAAAGATPAPRARTAPGASDEVRPAQVVPRDAGDSAAPAPLSPAGLDWDALRELVAGCRQCGLCESRTQTVFGVGDRQADWLIVGEAPGADEDRKGEPFVGRAGRLLNAMLNATGRRRGQVYIANILKCRPPSNRDPHNDEAAACRPFLDRQIELLQPRIILAVGRIAAQRLLGVDTPLGRLRGQVHSYGETNPVPLVVTYHPAYLLRSPTHKRQAWEDLLFAQRVAASPVQ